MFFLLISGTYNLCITVLEHIMYVINIVDKYVIRCNCPAVYMHDVMIPQVKMNLSN